MKLLIVITTTLFIVSCSKNEQKDSSQTEPVPTEETSTTETAPSDGMDTSTQEAEPAVAAEPTAEEKAAMCAEKIERGTCKGSLLRFAYDAEKDVCEQFTYGGCGGTKNNFRTREACEATCYKTSE